MSGGSPHSASGLRPTASGLKAAIDPSRLTQSELLQMVNATPLGTVLTRSRLRRQMDAGALKFGDGTHVHLVRYARWLVDELERPRPARMDYAEARRRQAERNRAATKASQDIHPIPEIVDFERRQRCAESFRAFCETYFPAAFHRAWSEDHLRVIERIERAVRSGGLFAFAMPRGSGKTTLARCSALWAVLYGYRPFVCLIGAADDRAKELLLPIKKHIVENPLLLADFPEAVYPLRCLENSSKRQLQQHIEGRLTHVHWGQEKLVFPTIEGDHLPRALRERGHEVSPSCGSIITTTSLDANMRGQQHTRVDGSVIRPSLVLLDDPQTRQSAASPTQTRRRMELLNGDVLGMAGPGEQIAAVLTCTKIYDGDLADQVLDREKSPEWDSECTRLVYAFPTNEKLWDEYANVRRSAGPEAATQFYRRHRAAMDAGAVVAWPARYDAKTEISAIQHAMNLKLKVGHEAFASEYQNEPLPEEQVDDELLTVDQIMAKVNGHRRGEVPLAATHLTMFIDVQAKALFWLVAAWENDFSGYVLDYGTEPDQKAEYFTLRDIRRTLAAAAPRAGIEGAIYAGLERLTEAKLGREWQRDDGSTVRIDRCLIDANWGQSSDVVYQFCRQSRFASVLLPSHGRYVGAASIPFSEYKRKRGDRVGLNWRVPVTTGRRIVRHVVFDTNFWKSFIHARLAVPMGDPGGLSLFGRQPERHRLFAEHLTSEYRVKTEGRGRMVDEWKLRVDGLDNHWLDCLVGSAVAASMGGAAPPGLASDAPRPRPAVRLSELQRTRR